MTIILGVLTLCTIIISIFIIGIYIPTFYYVGMYSSILTSFYSIYGVIVILILSLLVGTYFFIYGGNIALGVFILSLINFTGWMYPIFQIYSLAHKHSVRLSLIDNLRLELNRDTPNTDTSIKYVTVDGKDLYLDYYPAKNISENEKVKPLIFIHGGGFVDGNRSQEPEWREFYRNLGYSVFDVEYRLASKEYQTWDTAASDINSAIVWLTQNSEIYDVDMSQLVLAGSSAGASLALQAGYGGLEEFPSYIPGEYTKAYKIIAYFPAISMEPLWNRDTKFLSITSRGVGMQYTGGGPEEFPERYDKINTALLANQSAPPTLVIHGKSDHLIPYDTLLPLQQALKKNNIQNTFVFIPYAEHGFTYFSGSFGFQIAKKVTQDFLTQ